MTRALSPKTLREIRWHLNQCSCVLGAQSRVRVLGLVDAALRPKKFLAPARKRKAAKLRSKKSETRDIRAAVFERAGNRCELCGDVATDWEHAFGRTRVPAKVSNTLALCRQCHRERTRLAGGALFWWRTYACHFKKHGYHQEQSMAEALAEKHRVKAELRGRA